MKAKHGHLEYLISKRLDDLLDEDEQLMLDRRLIRDPEARRMMDAYREADDLAAAALGEAVVDRSDGLDPQAWIEGVSQPGTVQRAPRWWWLVPGSIAAGMLAILVNSLTFAPPRPVGTQMAEGTKLQPSVGRVAPVSAPSTHNVARNVSMPPRQKIRRDVIHNTYGIMGREGVLYWIEVDRMRTIKRPNPKANVHPVLHEM
ncbi:MAG: hypothetical protein ACE5E5_05570 [Phycisphaerae bacterium]